jgi:hypothetical protein
MCPLGMFAVHKGTNTVYQVSWLCQHVRFLALLESLRSRPPAPKCTRTCRTEQHWSAVPALQFFTHTELVGRLWWPLELVLNTPSHHRVHHARNYGRRCAVVNRWATCHAPCRLEALWGAGPLALTAALGEPTIAGLP